MTKSSILSKLLCLILVIWGAIAWQSLPGLTILPGYLHGCDVLADSSGDFIVYGSFVNDLEFGALRLSSPEGVSGFVAKLSRTGNWMWARKFSSEYSDYMLGEKMLVWLEADGIIGVTGPFSWEAPYGKSISDSKDEVLSLAYMNADGQFIALDNEFQKSHHRRKQLRPETDEYEAKPRVLTVQSGELEYRAGQDVENQDSYWDPYEYEVVEASYSNLPARIVCLDTRTGRSWELEFTVNPERENLSPISIFKLASNPRGGVTLVGSFTGRELFFGGSRLANSSDQAQLFIGSLASDGTLNWLKPLEALKTDIEAGGYDLLCSPEGNVLYTENSRVEGFEHTGAAIIQRFYCYDDSGKEIWRLNLGREVDIPGFSVLVSSSEGNYFYNPGITENDKVMQAPSLIGFEDNGAVKGRCVNLDSPWGQYVTARALPGGDLIFAWMVQRPEYGFNGLVAACYSKDLDLKWKKSLQCQSLDPLSYTNLILTYTDAIYLSAIFDGSASWDGRALSTSGQKGVLILKLDQQGNLLSNHKALFNNTPRPLQVNICFNAKGFIYLCGTDGNILASKPTNPVSGNGNSYLYRVGPKGEILWMHRFDYQGTSALNMSSDQQGKIHLLGTIPKGTFKIGAKKISNTGEPEQVVLMSFNPEGSCIELKRLASFDPEARRDYYPLMIKCFPDDELIYVAYQEVIDDGWGYESEQELLRLISYNPANGLLSRMSYDFPEINCVADLEAGPDRSKYLAIHKTSLFSGMGDYDSGYLTAFNTQLELLWKHDLVCDYHVNPDGSVYFSNRFFTLMDLGDHVLPGGFPMGDQALGKISANGKVEWLRYGYEYGEPISQAKLWPLSNGNENPNLMLESDPSSPGRPKINPIRYTAEDRCQVLNPLIEELRSDNDPALTAKYEQALAEIGNIRTTTASSLAGDGEVVNFVPYDDPPAIIGELKPVYPDFAKRARVQGTVVLNVEVYKDGSVGNITVQRSVTGLDDAAIEAVRKVRFQPGMSSGQVVDTTVIIPVEFRLN